MERIYNGLTAAERENFFGSTILFTGGAGFLGFYFIAHYRKEINVEKIICPDNFKVGYPKRLKELKSKVSFGDGVKKTMEWLTAHGEVI